MINLQILFTCAPGFYFPTSLMVQQVKARSSVGGFQDFKMAAEFLPYIESPTALWVNLSSIFENMQAPDHMEIKANLKFYV